MTGRRWRPGDPGYREAAERWRHQWRHAERKEALSFEEAHGAGVPASAAAPAWDRPPADLAQVLPVLQLVDDLGAEADRGRQAQLYARLVDQQAAELVAWRLANPPPDPSAPLPLSQAEQARRAAVEAEQVRAMRGT